MKWVMLFVCACASLTAVAGSQDPIITDPAEIAAFLESPDTKSLDVAEPTGWKNYRKYLQVGRRNAQGGCTYSSHATTNQPLRQLSMEVAVDRKSCKSLILEGEPDEETWDAVQRFRRQLKQNYMDSHGGQNGGLHPDGGGGESSKMMSTSTSSTAFNSDGAAFSRLKFKSQRCLPELGRFRADG